MKIAFIILIVLILLWISWSSEHFKDRGYWPILHRYGPYDAVLKVYYKRGDELQTSIVYGNGSISRKVGDSIFFDPRPDTGRLFAAFHIVNFPFRKLYNCNQGIIDYIVEFDGEDGPKQIEIGCGPAELYNNLSAVEQGRGPSP